MSARGGRRAGCLGCSRTNHSAAACLETGGPASAWSTPGHRRSGWGRGRAGRAYASLRDARPLPVGRLTAALPWFASRSLMPATIGWTCERFHHSVDIIHLDGRNGYGDREGAGGGEAGGDPRPRGKDSAGPAEGARRDRRHGQEGGEAPRLEGGRGRDGGDGLERGRAGRRGEGAGKGGRAAPAERPGGVRRPAGWDLRADPGGDRREAGEAEATNADAPAAGPGI